MTTTKTATKTATKTTKKANKKGATKMQEVTAATESTQEVTTQQEQAMTQEVQEQELTASERLERARAMVRGAGILATPVTNAATPIVSTTKTASEKESQRAELMKATMTHPITGKTVKQAYFSESLVSHGLTIMQWIEDNFVSREEHERVVQELKKGANVEA